MCRYFVEIFCADIGSGFCMCSKRESPLRFLLVIKHPVPALMDVTPFLLTTGAGTEILDQPTENIILLSNLLKIINLIKNAFFNLHRRVIYLFIEENNHCYF